MGAGPFVLGRSQGILAPVSDPAASPGPLTLLRRWFGFSMPVGRRFYFLSGVFLMAVKYAGDVALVWVAHHHFWRPGEWLNPTYAGRFAFLGNAGIPHWSIGVWAIPFLWIGVSMTFRRAVDAGRSAWWALLFFAPVVNLAIMLGFCVPPSAPAPAWKPEPARARSDEMMRSALLGVLGMMLLGVPLIALQTLGLGQYSSGLFFATPFVLGATAGYLFNRRFTRSLAATAAVVIAGFAILFGGLLLFALEGVVCLLMALPFALLVGTFGGWVGREIAAHTRGGAVTATLSMILLPLSLSAFVDPAPVHREVISTVEIAAPPEIVWRHVVGFEPLAPPSELLFNVGVAYPVRARIEGTGVGAVRRCEFSTGAFVEPITAWDEPRRLSFDVASSPPPLEEWSPYRKVLAPHLATGFRAQRGEFRLVPLGRGRTRLEGSTWYALDIHPAFYWTPWADAFVHQIHLRVLEHITTLAEHEAARVAATP